MLKYDSEKLKNVESVDMAGVRFRENGFHGIGFCYFANPNFLYENGNVPIKFHFDSKIFNHKIRSIIDA